MQQLLQIMTKNFIMTGLVMAWVVLPLIVFSQPVLKIDHNAGCYNTETLIPVELEHFEDVAAFTLYIGVNTANVEFVGVEDVNEVFVTGDFVGGVNLESQTIVLNWASFTPVNLENGLMCKIRVLFKSDAVNFDFQDNCEIVRSDLSIIENVEYVDGSLVTLSSFTVDPATQTILEGESVTIQVTDLIEGISTQWQKKENENWSDLADAPPYSGAQTTKLSIQSVSASLNSSLFRCKLSSSTCSDGSTESELLVTPNDVDELNGPAKVTPIKIYPNPVDKHLNCVFNANVSSAELRLVNIHGVILNQLQLGDIISGKVISLRVENAEAGIYVVQLLSGGQIIADLKVLKI